MANRIETGLKVKGLSGDTNALYVTGNSFINGDVNITGNVNIVGTATTLNTETVQTRDNKILLNYSGTNLTAIGGGIEVLSAKTDGTNVSLTSDINGDWNSNTGLNISGRTSDSTTNGLKVVNSSGTNNFVVRNDGNVGVGTSTPTSKLDIDLGGTSGTDIAIQTRGSIPFLVNNRTTFSVNNNGRLTAGNLISLPSSFGHSFAAPIGSTNAFNVHSDDYTQGLFFVNTDGSFSLGNGVQSGAYFESNGTNTFRFYGANSGQSQKIGINVTNPNSTLEIRGSDSSSNFGLKVQNSGGTDNLVVRNDGNVGIGTLTPNAPLDVNGKIYSRTGGVYTDTIRTYGAVDLTLYGYPDTVFVNNVEVMRIKSVAGVDAAYIGIGTGAPTAKLHINNTSLSANTFLAEDDTNPDFTPFVIDNLGNVGVGTLTPVSKLDINGTNGYEQLRLRTSFTPTGSTDTRGNVGDIAWDDNNFYWKTSTQWLKVSGQTF